MELHKAIKEIIASKGADMITNAQIINYLLDYQAFKDKPATKSILRDMINSHYVDKIIAIDKNIIGWQNQFKQIQYDFVVSYGYKEDLVAYVFYSIAYGLELQKDEDFLDASIVLQNQGKVDPFVSDISNSEISDIMKKAREGDKKSILYCVEKKIDPFNYDSDFFFNYNEIKIGDWFYDDGSFSRRRSDLKNCVGVVFSLMTSQFEKSDGWSHGLIVAIRDAAEREWGKYGDLPYPHTHYTNSDLVKLKENPHLFEDYQTEYLIKDSDIETFKVARNFGLGLPKGKTSGWYLPSISQLHQIATNLSPETLSRISMNGDKLYLSSSQSNANEVCVCYLSKDIDGKTYYSIDTSDKQCPLRNVRPIAAF